MDNKLIWYFFHITVEWFVTLQWGKTNRRQQNKSQLKSKQEMHFWKTINHNIWRKLNLRQAAKVISVVGLLDALHPAKEKTVSTRILRGQDRGQDRGPIEDYQEKTLPSTVGGRTVDGSDFFWKKKNSQENFTQNTENFHTPSTVYIQQVRLLLIGWWKHYTHSADWSSLDIKFKIYYKFNSIYMLYKCPNALWV